MSDEEEPTFETADAGSSATYPAEAGTLRKGSHVMIKGKPCKCIELSSSKTGKHGHAKIHIVALDIFTGKKYEDLCPASHNVSVPFVTKTEYMVLDANEDEESISLLTADGDTKDDLNLPTMVKQGASDSTEDDRKVTKEILALLEAGKTVYAVVQAACGEEKIIQALEKAT